MTGTTVFPLHNITPLREQLAQHPVYRTVTGLDSLKVFMSHHVFSVWDFMSLLKQLQNHLAPAGVPWAPGGRPLLERFINEIVLEEESDTGLPDAHGKPTYLSHFEMYCQAMEEVGVDAVPVRDFAREAHAKGFHAAKGRHALPPPAVDFMTTTFGFIESGQIHQVAAAFALGREHIIPTMFRSLLHDMHITSAQAPVFHYYLERHIHLDQDHHGPLSMTLLESLCGGDAAKLAEAEQAAITAIQARLRFWDGVAEAIGR